MYKTITTKPEVECPTCGNITGETFVMHAQVLEKLGLKKRNIAGYCIQCNASFELEQYGAAGKWIATQYRLQRTIGMVPQQWQKLAEIPVSAVVIGFAEVEEGVLQEI